MSKAAFDKIARGLTDAIGFAEGENTTARLHAHDYARARTLLASPVADPERAEKQLA